MDTYHLKEILKYTDKQNLVVGNVISDYTRTAINFSVDDKPNKDDYDLSFQTVIEKLKNNYFKPIGGKKIESLVELEHLL